MARFKWFDFGAGVLVGALGINIIRNIFSSIGQAIKGLFKTVVTEPRKEFNDAVATGKYDFDFMFEETEREYHNYRTLERWLFAYRKTHQYTGPLLSGHIYAFDYDPLDKYQAYDTTPVALSFGTYAASTGNLVEYGVNLHWLPLEVRKAFLHDIFEHIKQTYKGIFYSNTPRPIDTFNYDVLRPYVDKYHIDYAVRSYVQRGRFGTIMIDYQDWPKGCLIESKGFRNFDSTKLRQLYMQHVIAHRDKTMVAKERERQQKKFERQQRQKK